jgi:hypothetical protein
MTWRRAIAPPQGALHSRDEGKKTAFNAKEKTSAFYWGGLCGAPCNMARIS